MKKYIFYVALSLMSTSILAQSKVDIKTENNPAPKPMLSPQKSIGIENLNFASPKPWVKPVVPARTAIAPLVKPELNKIEASQNTANENKISVPSHLSGVSHISPVLPINEEEKKVPMSSINVSAQDYMSIAQLKDLYLEKKQTLNTSHTLQVSSTMPQNITPAQAAEFEPHLAPAPLESQGNLQEPTEDQTTSSPQNESTENPPRSSAPYGVWPPIPDGPNSPQAQIEELKNYPPLNSQ